MAKTTAKDILASIEEFAKKKEAETQRIIDEQRTKLMSQFTTPLRKTIAKLKKDRDDIEAKLSEAERELAGLEGRPKAKAKAGGRKGKADIAAIEAWMPKSAEEAIGTKAIAEHFGISDGLARNAVKNLKAVKEGDKRGTKWWLKK